MVPARRRQVRLATLMILVAVFGLSFALIRAERARRSTREARNRAVERLAWSERMQNLGYVSAAQVAADRARLRRIDAAASSR